MTKAIAFTQSIVMSYRQFVLTVGIPFSVKITLESLVPRKLLAVIAPIPKQIDRHPGTLAIDIGGADLYGIGHLKRLPGPRFSAIEQRSPTPAKKIKA